MRDAEQVLTLVWLLCWIPHSMCHSPPGRPRLTRCRSPEKETFSCWWEPGSSGGLPTRYQLYYRKENSVEVFECPDYHKAGINSCHFEKRHTAIWIIYNITVVASNALGKAYSEPVEVDVMDIVQPHPPESVNVSLMQSQNSQYVLVQWLPPHDVDTRSGWVTIKYEVRSKILNSRDEDSSWESYSAGKQLEFSIYSPHPGANYAVHVRCKLDQGLWSDWSPSAFIQIPDNMTVTQNAVVIFSVTLTVVIFMLTAGIMTFKKKQVKHFLLPPVPEPKISGLNTQLLKSGRSEEIFSALITPGLYTQISQSADHQVEYLVVSECDEEKTVGKAHFEIQKAEICLIDATESSKGNSIVLGEPQKPLHLDCNVKTHDRNTRMSSKCKCEQVDITSAGPTGYVEVDREQPEQKDYSVVSDVINDNVLVLQDSIPVQGHKEFKCPNKNVLN